MQAAWARTSPPAARRGRGAPGHGAAAVTIAAVTIAIVTVIASATAAPAHGADAVAVAPLETLGTESKVSRALQSRIARALAAVPGVEVVDGRQIRRALARKPALRSCDGDAGCLAELGRAVSARYVVYGEVGGLGAVELVYLEVIDVAAGRELRSTTLDLGGPAGQRAERARAAAFRLLAPARYRGTLAVDVDVEGASIYVDGRRVGRSPGEPVALAVGTHALRVTHPEFRDYVRFVDVAFDERTSVDVDLQKFPVVATAIQRDSETGQIVDGGMYRGQESTPWYRRWYSVAGFGAAVLIGSALVVGLIADGVDADREIEVN